MATKTSFKQQCPSCEAMVPIRDPSLVGRKIDCPKCKYRFVVEEPEPEEPDEAAPSKAGKKGAKPGAAAKGDKGEKKKEEGSNKTLGIVLVVVALALVGAGVYLFVFAGGDE